MPDPGGYRKVSHTGHRLKHEQPSAYQPELEDQERQDSRYFTTRGEPPWLPGAHEARKVPDISKSFSKGSTNSTLKKPITTTSLESTSVSAAAASARVVAAGPVRFFSQLTMSSASLPATPGREEHWFAAPQSSTRTGIPSLRDRRPSSSREISRNRDSAYATLPFHCWGN